MQFKEFFVPLKEVSKAFPYLPVVSEARRDVLHVLLELHLLLIDLIANDTSGFSDFLAEFLLLLFGHGAFTMSWNVVQITVGILQNHFTVSSYEASSLVGFCGIWIGIIFNKILGVQNNSWFIHTLGDAVQFALVRGIWLSWYFAFESILVADQAGTVDLGI